MQDNGMYLVYMCGTLLVAQGVESVFYYPEGWRVCDCGVDEFWIPCKLLWASRIALCKSNPCVMTIMQINDLNL